MKRAVALAAIVLSAAVSFTLFGLPADGLVWTQTSETDFRAGAATSLEILPSGDLRLATAAGAWTREGIVLDVGPGGSADSHGARNPVVMKDGSTYRMWYGGFDDSRNRLLYATSSDGVTWNRQGVVINVQTPPYNFDSVVGAFVTKDGATFRMWFHGGFWSGGPAGNWGQIYYATSSDGASWSIQGVAVGLGALGTWDDSMVHFPSLTQDGNGRYWMYYSGWDGVYNRIGLATSTTASSFTRSGIDPVIILGPTGSWDAAYLATTSVLAGSPWRLWYSGSEGSVTRIGSATSNDGFNWTKSPGNPEFSVGPPGAWDDIAVHGQSILQDGATTFLYYTGSDGSNNRIGRARMTPGFTASGVFESAILDTQDGGTVWGTFSANATVPAGTQVGLSTRSGDVPTPDGSWSPWSTPVPSGVSSIVSPRARYLQARAIMSTTDAALTPVLHDFSVEYEPNRAGTPTPISPVGGAWVNTSGLRLEWAHSDPESDGQAGFQVHVSRDSSFGSIPIDSEEVRSVSSLWNTPPLADGSWFWRVRTLDAHGRWSSYSSTAFVRIDTTAPLTFLGFASPPGFVNGLPQIESTNAIVLLSFDANSGVSDTLYSVDLGPQTTYTGPFLPAGHGVKLIGYSSSDIAGNREDWALATLLVDDPPSAARLGPTPGSWSNSSSIEVQWAYSDPDGDSQAAYEVHLSRDPSFTTIDHQSGIIASSASAQTFRGVPDGQYSWRVRVSDSFGVWSPFTSTGSFSVDTVGPVVTHSFSDVRGLVDGRVWIAPGAMLTLSATDAGSGVARIVISIDGSLSTYTEPIAVSSHGQHRILYWAEDSAGNPGPASTVEVLVDQEPAALPSLPADQAWVTGPAMLVWDYTDPDGDPRGGFEVQLAVDAGFQSIVLSSGSVQQASASWQSPPLDEGSFYWRVRVSDGFGVWSQWSPPRLVRVDTIAPVTRLLQGGQEITESAATLFVGDAIVLEASDGGSGVRQIEYSLDGGPWTAYSVPISFDSSGRRTIAVRALDMAGNVEPTRVLVLDVRYPTNWTPLIALLMGILLAVGGAVAARGSAEPTTGRSTAATWATTAGPWVGIEIALGGYSLITGELATPPWSGPGLIALTAAAVAGMLGISLVGRAIRERARSI